MTSVSIPQDSTSAGENTRLIILISCVATIGGFLFGFDSGVINGTVDGLKQTFQSSSAGTGFEVASMLLGCAFGAFFAGRLADRWGRRTVLIISAVLFLLSAHRRGHGQHLAGVHHRARARRIRGRRGQRDVAGLHRRGRVRRAIAAGWRRCSRSRSSAACSAPSSATTCWPRPPVRPPRRCGWGTRPGAGCSGCRRSRRRSSCCCCCSFRRARATWW